MYEQEFWARGWAAPEIDARGTLPELTARMDDIQRHAQQARPDFVITRYERTESVRMYAWQGSEMAASWAVRPAVQW
ncbi:hypothetical protein [Nocardia sp. IFM 10818]